MNSFNKALNDMIELIYEPHHFSVQGIQEETQNSDYGAGFFQLHSKSVRFRVAKITPAKTGQFVAFWEKGLDHKNQAYSYGHAADLWVVHTYSTENRSSFGQFVFPKEVLAERGILRTASAKGKMAIRVYPAWDTPTSKQAIATQKWQLPYFAAVNNRNSLQLQELARLYSTYME